MKFTSLVALIGATSAVRMMQQPGMKTNNDSPVYLSTHDKKDNIINPTNIQIDNLETDANQKNQSLSSDTEPEHLQIAEDINLEMDDDMQSPEDGDYLNIDSDDEDWENEQEANIALSESRSKMGMKMKKPKAIDTLKAKYSLKSFWSHKWSKMELTSKTGFAMSRKQIRENDLDYWAMIELPSVQTIEKILLMRRGDLNQISRKFKQRIISKIRIEYFNGEKWQYYKAGALLPTGQVKSDSAEKIRSIKVEPFVALKVKIHFPEEGRNYRGCTGRIDLVAHDPTAKMMEVKDGKKAINDLGSTTIQSSMWSNKWASPKNVNLNSKSGFHNAGKSQGEDFWITTSFPKGEIYEVTQLILKKRFDNCCNQRLILGVIIEYFDGQDWVLYNNGKALSTGQSKEDGNEKERFIWFEPFLASKVRVRIPRKLSNVGSIHGRFDFIIVGPIKTTGEVADARSHISKRAIMDLGANYEVQSMWNKKWSHLELNSVTGFHLGHAEVKKHADFWVMVDLGKETEVSQVLLKKRPDYFKHPEWKLTERVIHKIKVEYNDGKKWIQYKDGALLETGQTRADEAEKIREINLIPFNATQVKIHFPRSERNNQWCDGRLDLLVTAEEEAKNITGHKLAIADFGAITQQSSQLDAKHSDGKNVRLDSTTGFANADGEDKDFDVTVDLGTDKEVHQVTKMILKKSADAKDDSLINGFTLQYYDGNNWIQYNKGNITFTNQKEDDKTEMERQFVLNPAFLASKIKVTFPRDQRSSTKCHGRLDFYVQGIEKGSAETGDTPKLAMGTLGATSIASSNYKGNKAGHEGANNVKLDSHSCFHNDGWEFQKTFWIVVDFPKTDFYEVSQVIFKKRFQDGSLQRTIDGFQIQYYNGKEWVFYKGGEVFKLGQLPSDDKDLERSVTFDPPFTAQKVSVVIPRDQRNEGPVHGRLDFMIKGPVEPETDQDPPKKVKEEEAEEPNTKLANLQLNATYELSSWWSKKWSHPSLTDKLGFWSSKKFPSTGKDYWMAMHFRKFSEVHEIILMKRGDYEPEKRIFSKIRIQYYDGQKWAWYKDKEMLATGQKAEDDRTAVYRIPVEPFKATILKIWVPVSESYNSQINGRFDAMIVEAEEDPDTVRAIASLNATTTQSSAWSEEYTSSANIVLGAKYGFFNGKDNYKDDYWFSTKLPGQKLHEFKSMIFQKSGHSCCKKRLIHGFKIQYFNGKKWVWYNNGEIVKTHQYKYDSLQLERNIEFEPTFLASEIKVIIPLSERTNSAQGRYDFLVVPPTESQVVAPKKGDKCTADEVQEADSDAKRAIAQLGATWNMQSQWNEKWSSPKIGSEFGFHNSEEAAQQHQDFWVEVNLQKPSQVQQIIIQKRGDFDTFKCDEGKQKDIINKFRIDYFVEGNEYWTSYKDDVLLETGQDLNDTANLERRIYVDEQFIANKVRVYFPSSEVTGSGDGFISGRLDVVVVEQEEDQDETDDGTGEQDENVNSYTNRAIMDFDSTSEQSSRYSDDWATEKNIFLKSGRGFINKASDFKSDFWLSVKFPANQFFEVRTMVLKKITHSCCTKRTINGFSLQYLYKGKWINYNNGEIIKTGQLPDDDVDFDRLIEFTPFIAQQVRITIPRSERSHGSAQGRVEFLIDGPIKQQKKKSGKTTTGGSGSTNTTTTSGGSSNTTTTSSGSSNTTTTSSGSTNTTTTTKDETTTESNTNTTESYDEQSAESNDGTCNVTTETTSDEDEQKTDTSVQTITESTFNETASKRAILDFGSTTDQSSVDVNNRNWDGWQWANIKSKNGFNNKPGDSSDFWINVIFPARRHYQVSTLVLKKIHRNVHKFKNFMINGVIIEYQTGGKWVKFNGGAVIKTGMAEKDDMETEYIIDFYPPFLATEVKAHVPRTLRGSTDLGGRIEYLIEGPVKGPEVEDTTNTTTTFENETSSSNTTSSNDTYGEGETSQEDESGSETSTTTTTTSSGETTTTKTTTTSDGETTVTTTTSGGGNTTTSGSNTTTSGSNTTTSGGNTTTSGGKTSTTKTTVTTSGSGGNTTTTTKVTTGGKTTTTKTTKTGGKVTNTTTETKNEDEETTETGGSTTTTEVNTTTTSGGGSGSTQGQPLKKERPHEAILDYGSTSEQSSYWSSSWGGEDAARIDSKTGFYPKDSDSDKDFWITTKFPAGKHYLVNEFILKKIVHSCCTKRVVSGFQLEYMQNGEWIKWNNGQIIKTGQLPSDDVEMERKIIFTTPFLATEVKIVIPVSEKDQQKWAQGRIEFIIEGPKAPPKKVIKTINEDGEEETTEEKTTEGSTTTTTGGGGSSSGGSTTSSGGSTTNSGSSSSGSYGWQRAILDYHSSTYTSSAWGKQNIGNDNYNLTSQSGFHNSKDKSEEDFWFTFDFPEYDFFEVNQLILKKRASGSDETKKRTLDGFTVQFFDGKDWNEYNGPAGRIFKTGQLPEDDWELERKFTFQEKFLAQKVKITFPRDQRSTPWAHGRIELLINKPKNAGLCPCSKANEALKK